MRSAPSPTSWATFWVTYWLSPVMISTEIPFCFSASKNGMNPLLRGVKECCKSEQRHVMLRCRGVDILLFYLLHCDPENAVPVGTQLLEGLCCVRPLAFIERTGTPIDVDGLADGKDALSLALGDEEMLGTMPHHHGKALAVEVEGYLVHLLVLHDGRVLVLQDRSIQGALDAGFKVTVQIDHPQDVVVIFPLDVEVPVKHDLAFCECPRLITAENIYAAEVFDGRQLLDENLLPGHTLRALSQCDCDDHRHHLRRHPHGKRDRKEERIQQRTVEDDVYQQDEEHQEHRDPGDHHPEVPYAAGELGFRRLRGQALRNFTECSIPAGTNDDRGTNPGLNRGAQGNAVAGIGNLVFAR